MHTTMLCACSAAVYMCEWERMKPAHADPEGEGHAMAAPEEEQEGGEEATCPNQPPVSAGVTYELCAGIVDKPHLSLEEIACQEVLEECGYEVPVSKLRRITSYRCRYTPSTSAGVNILSKPWHSVVWIRFSELQLKGDSKAWSRWGRSSLYSIYGVILNVHKETLEKKKGPKNVQCDC